MPSIARQRRWGSRSYDPLGGVDPCLDRGEQRHTAPRFSVEGGGGGLDRRSEAGDADHVLHARSPRALLVAADEELVEANTATHHQYARARWAAELVPGDRHEVQSRRREVDRDLADRLGGVAVDPHPALAAHRGGLGDGLQRADLVVGPLEVNHRGLAVDRRGERVEVESSRTVDRHRRGAEPGSGPHRGVFDGREHLAGAASSHPATHGGDRLGRSRAEDHLARSGADRGSDAPSSVLDERP